MLYRYMYICRTDIHGSICEGEEISRSIFNCDVGIYEVFFSWRCRQENWSIAGGKGGIDLSPCQPLEDIVKNLLQRNADFVGIDNRAL